jgi:hypothetical protein
MLSGFSSGFGKSLRILDDKIITNYFEAGEIAVKSAYPRRPDKAVRPFQKIPKVFLWYAETRNSECWFKTPCVMHKSLKNAIAHR